MDESKKTLGAESNLDETQELVFASQWKLMWLRFRRHRLALIGGSVLFVFYGVAALCEFVAPYDPNQRPSGRQTEDHTSNHRD